MKIIVEKQSRELFGPVLRILSGEIGISEKYSDSPEPGAVNIGTVEFARRHAPCAEFISKNGLRERWEMAYRMEGDGYIVSGEDLGRINCIFLFLVDSILRGDKPLESGIRYPVFKRLYQIFDDCSTGFSRAGDDFDLEKHMFGVLRAGVENFEINILYDDIPIQVREKRAWQDKYQWWSTYMPALDMFYESSLSRGTYSPKTLHRNKAVLLETANLARGLGLKPIFTSFEPRAWPERLFDRYPELRGARVDKPGYSCETEYAPDPNHPLVSEHYRELSAQLIRDVPDLELFEVWSQDSCAGFPWAKMNKIGPNGPTGIRRKPVWQGVNNLMSAVKAGISDVNPSTRVHVNTTFHFPEDETAEIAEHIPDNIGLTFDFDVGRTSGRQGYWWEFLKKLDKKESQANFEGAVNYWKRYGPLCGFPCPQRVYRNLESMHDSGVLNVAARGGIHSSVYVPGSINNEVLRAFKYAGNKLDLDALLSDRARAWTNSSEEADILQKAWRLCDELDSAHFKKLSELQKSSMLTWTTAMFVSARTLFRTLVRPIVPDPSLLSYAERRYYTPHIFLTNETDPTWHDISYFEFKQHTSDEDMRGAVKYLDEVALPILDECSSVLRSAGGDCSDTTRDIRDRVECYYYISMTERDMLDTQLAVHGYKDADGAEEKRAMRNRVRENMLRDIDTTEKFIFLLKNSKSTLIPVTSGEETPFMFKAPLYNLLQRKIIAMKNHLDDKPGPDFEGDFFLQR